MTIGQLAEITNVSIDTIRYYEKLKLLPKPKRTESGYRKYTNENINKINYILRAKELGFTLREIKEMFTLEGCEDLCELTLSKIKQVQNEIDSLKKLKNKLKFLLKKCPAKGSIKDCSIMKSISKNKQNGNEKKN